MYEVNMLTNKALLPTNVTKILKLCALDEIYSI